MNSSSLLEKILCPLDQSLTSLGPGLAGLDDAVTLGCLVILWLAKGKPQMVEGPLHHILRELLRRQYPEKHHQLQGLEAFLVANLHPNLM